MHQNQILNIVFLLICLVIFTPILAHAKTISENFDSPELSDHWTIGPAVYQRDDTKWSLSKNPGYLTITTQSSDVHEKNNNPRNFFLRDVPYEDFQITTRLIFEPTETFEQAGLLVWEDTDNYLRLATIFTGEPRFEAGFESNAVFSGQQLQNLAGADLYLRIRKIGRQHSFHFSEDGESWEQIGTPVYVSHTDPQVGFFAISPGSGRAIDAKFEFFKIENLADVEIKTSAQLPPDSQPIELGPNQARVPFINPVYTYDAPDPTVYRHEDGYFYAITTNATQEGAFRRLPILRSLDLVNWELISTVFPRELPKWVHQTTPHLWAPDLVEHNGKYFVYYSAMSRDGKGFDGHGMGVAWADHPAGPYEFMDEALIEGPGFRNIDPMVFKDDDGTRIFYWGSDGYPMLAQELSDDGLSLIGEPKQVLTTQAGSAVIIDDEVGPRRPNHEGLVEGPWVIKRGDYYYMFYSGDGFNPDRYAVMVARSTSPWGPFEKYPMNPLMRVNEKFTSPGHNAIIQDDAGQDWIVYHAYDREHLEIDRVMLIDKIEWRDGWPTIRNFQGASYTWQTDGPIINDYQLEARLSLNKPITASSQLDNGHRAEFAVDGNLMTKWKAEDASMPQWIMVDLEDVYNITRTETVFESPVDFYQYYLEYSLDGENWETAVSRQNFFQDRTAYHTYRDQMDIEARYLRLVVTSTQPGWPLRSASIVDFRAFGPEK